MSGDSRPLALSLSKGEQAAFSAVSIVCRREARLLLWRSMRPRTISVALLLSLLLAACAENAGEPSASPTSRPAATPTPSEGTPSTATPPAIVVTPGENTPACAADSTVGFLQAQQAASFKVYCPTFLPAGFTLDDVHFEEMTQPGTPIPGPGVVVATFKRQSPTASIQFVQGRPALSVITALRTSSEEQPGETAYDGFQGNIFAKGVLARSPDGFTHVVFANGLTADELRQVAAAMQPLAP